MGGSRRWGRILQEKAREGGASVSWTRSHGLGKWGYSRLFPRRFPHRPCIASLHLLWPLVITHGCLLMSSCNEHPATVLTKAWTWTANHQVGWDREVLTEDQHMPRPGGRRQKVEAHLLPRPGQGSGKGQVLRQKALNAKLRSF